MAETITLDDYELINCIASGGSTDIWEVRQKSSGQSFAMKLLLDEAFKDGEQKKSLKNEFAIGKSFEHPNLIRFFDLVMTKKRGYFIMEYFRSSNLKQMIRSERAAVQSRAKKILEGVALALAYMHEKNWVHKDLKPDNILATKGSEVKVIDFSLASRPSGALLKLMGGSKSMVIQGTRTYLAPEMIRRKPLTFAADMYSLGITMFEIATGRPPFIQGNPNELLMAHVRDMPDRPSSYNPNVTPEADALILRMISKKPENRPKSMNDLAAELRSIKLFVEEPEEHARELATQDKAKFDDSIDGRLDSRTDASRDKSAVAPPPKAAAKVAPPSVTVKSTAPPPKPKPTAAQSAAQPTPPPGYPAPPPGYPPGYPMPQYPPGYPQQMAYYPGMPQGVPPQGWPQGYPPPQQLPPGYQYPPGYPGVPGAAPPGTPGQPPASGAVPPAGQPAAPSPAAPSPAGTQSEQPPAAPPPPPPAAEDDEDDLPLMTELPDVF